MVAAVACGYSPLFTGLGGKPCNDGKSEGGRLLGAPGGMSGVVVCGRELYVECGERLALLGSGLNANSC